MDIKTTNNSFNGPPHLFALLNCRNDRQIIHFGSETMNTTEVLVPPNPVATSLEIIKSKKKSLCSVHRRWICETLIANPEEWHVSQLAPAFAQKFPGLGTNYLTQTHIDNQRRKVRHVISKNLDDIQSKETNHDHNHTTSHDKTNNHGTTNISDLLNIDHIIYNASKSLANQAVYFVDLLDERRSRGEVSKDNDLSIPIQGLITPLEGTQEEKSKIQTDIDTKTAELVELLVKKRRYDANNDTVMATNDKSIFVGYVANRQPNNRSYHFVAGANSDIDDTAVKVLTAIYATQPLVGNNKKTKVIIATQRHCLFRSTRMKPTVRSESMENETKTLPPASSSTSS